MTPERYLRSYDDMTCYIIEAEAKIKKLEEERAQLYAESTPRPDGMPRSPGIGDPVANLAAKIAKKDGEIGRWKIVIDMYVQRQKAIEEMLADLGVNERNVARLRYMRPQQMRWDEISRVLNYSEKQCKRFNKSLLKKISQKMSRAGHKIVV